MSTTQDDRISLAERNTLASLIGLCADQLNLNIEYDGQALERVEVTLRLGKGITGAELWTLTNRLLASHGFTTVRMPGETLLSVVKLTDAAKQAAFSSNPVIQSDIGFAVAVRRIEHAPIEEVSSAISAILSQPGGVARQLGTTDLLLVADLSPRLSDILDLLDLLDRSDPDDEVIVGEHPVRLANAPELVAQVNAAVEAMAGIDGQRLEGRLTMSLHDARVVLVVPRREWPRWIGLIDQFDVAMDTDTRSYQPLFFSIPEVASLIRKTLDADGARGALHIVEDDLTGSLIVTGTEEQHNRVQSLLARLDEPNTRRHRTTRTFTIRNRALEGMVTVLEQIIDTESLVVEPTVDADINALEAQSSISHEPGVSGGLQIKMTGDPITNTIIASGTPKALDQLGTLIKRLDIRQPQVELQLVVVSLNDSEALDLGVELHKLEVSGSSLIGLSSLFGLANLALDGSSPLLGGRGFSGVVLSPGDFSIVVRALQTINVGATRQYPKLLVRNNQTATLDSELQEPLLAINASDTVATTSFGGTQNAGTNITVTPQIAPADHINLEYQISLSAFVGDSSDPSLPPPRQETSIQSVVTIPDGYAIAVGALEIERDANADTRLPGLGQIPLIGELFKSQSKSTSRSRFYIFIRADILRHDRFEDLRFLSAQSQERAGLDSGAPTPKPRIIR